MILVTTLLTGAIVSISGVIGFVGLTIPHITRSVVGSKHTRLIPAATLVGGTFLVLADVISRVIISPEKEAKMRQHLMGHTSEKSGNIYNQRYIREKANKILLDLQIQFQKKVDNYESE